MSSIARTIAYCLFWYTSNIVVVISNKYLLTNYDFKYPIFLTGCHMVACAALAYFVSVLRVVPKQEIHTLKQFWKIAILACTFCLSVVLGNISLRFIPVSFNQTIGATTPLFTALVSLAILHQWESPKVYLSLIPVALGLVIATHGEPMFNSIGFLAAILATFGRAFKSVLSGVLLTDPSEKMNSMNLLLYMAPIAASVLLPVIVLLERDVLNTIRLLSVTDRYFLPALTVNAVLSFMVNLSNFMVTKQTSALTLQVLGNAKGVVAAGLSILLFKNPVTVRGLVGYGIALAGVALYSVAKSQAPKEQAKSQACRSKVDDRDPVVDSESADSPTIKSFNNRPHNILGKDKAVSHVQSQKIQMLAHAGTVPSLSKLQADNCTDRLNQIV